MCVSVRLIVELYFNVTDTVEKCDKGCEMYWFPYSKRQNINILGARVRNFTYVWYIASNIRISVIKKWNNLIKIGMGLL